jgi:hypothetical protein
VVEQSKKSRGVRKKESQMANFRNVLANCGLSDLGFTGSKYTWTNCQSDGNFIKERLDRAVANAAWCDIHHSIEVRVLTTCTSDHKPIVLQLFGMAQTRVSFKKSFKVEASWMHDEEYDEVVKRAWRGEECLGDVLATQKLEWCQKKLTAWSSRKFRKAEKELEKKTKALEELQQ